MEPDQKKKAVLLCVLLVILGVVWYIVLFGVPGGSGGAAPTKGTGVPAEKKELASEEGEDKQKKETGKDGESKEKPTPEEVDELITSIRGEVDRDMPEFAGFEGDPFARSVNPPEETAEKESQGKKAEKIEEKKIPWPTLHLTSIFWSPNSPMATINGDVIEPGDTLGREGAVEVKAISEDSVTLVYTTGGGRAEKTLTPGTKLGS